MPSFNPYEKLTRYFSVVIFSLIFSFSSNSQSSTCVQDSVENDNSDDWSEECYLKDDCTVQGNPCQSNDVTLIGAYLADHNGDPVPTCVGGEEVTVYLWGVFENGTGTDRYAVRTRTEVLKDGVFYTEINGCSFDLLPSGTMDFALLGTFTYTCGTELSLQNTWIAWATSASVCSDVMDPDYISTCVEYSPSKCWEQTEIDFLTPNFSYTCGETTDTTTQICFQDLTTGGTPPNSYSWDFGDGSPISTEASPCHTYSATSGQFTVTLIVTDAVGVQAGVTLLVDLDDPDLCCLAPVITCPGDTIVTCLGDLPAVDLNQVTFIEGCGTVTITLDTTVVMDSLCVDGKTILRTFKATDSNGNVDSCTQMITVMDTIPPSVTCPADVSGLLCGEALPMADMSSVVVSDNCTPDNEIIISFVNDVPNGGGGCTGDTLKVVRTYSATDLCGNISMCTQTFTYDIDITPPTVTCPADVSGLLCGEALPMADISSVVVSDNCTPDNEIVVAFVSDVSNAGVCTNGTLIVTRTYSATDLCDNESICTQTFSYDGDPSAFDLALRKVNPISGPSEKGDTIPFEITVFNQGLLMAVDIEITDYIPGGLALASIPENDGWSLAGDIATYIVSEVAPSMDTTLTIHLVILQNAVPLNVVNMTEVSSAFNVLGAQYLSDYDSDFDVDNTNDIGNELYDLENNDKIDEMGIDQNGPTGMDEDDHDQEWALLCNGMSCNGQVNFSLDESCSGSILPSMILTGDLFPDHIYEIIIINEQGDTVPNSFGIGDVGMTFKVSVFNKLCADNNCWLYVTIEYKFDPIIECIENDTLSCTQAFSEASEPNVSSNCVQSELVKIFEEVDEFSCDSMFTAKMTRRWIAKDIYGNTSDTCTQMVFLKRTNLDSISPVLPFALFNNNALYCGSGFATTSQGYPFPALSVTGAPKLKLENGDFVDLYPFDAKIICNGYAEFSDEILFGSTKCVTKIMRTFTIGEWWCSETNQREFVQLIEVVDFEGPTVTCPKDLTISTTSFSCEGYISVDLPSVGDACNGDNIRIDLSAPTSPSGFIKDYTGQTIMLPVGDNELTYRVYDDCNNRTDCSFTVTVRDDADPIAICDQFTIVGIGLESLTKVSAESIDDGSYDECGPVGLEVARMDAPGFDDFTGFGPYVDITCEDVGNVVMVGLLVTDAGGNTNMCMASIEVQDKVDAKFTCPGDMVVECNFAYDPANLSSFFGEVVIYDNCPEANTVDDNLLGSLNSCGSGVLIREIRLLNAQGEQVDYCTQQITFESGTTLQYSDIMPPPSEVTVTGCGVESIDPSILGMPIIPDNECQLSAISITNDTFPFTANGACLKIIRTFKVIDWCLADGPGSIYNPFEFTQTIKVNNLFGPEISVFADSIFCSYNVGCGPININGYLIATSIDDCTEEDDLLNRFEVRDSDGKVVNIGSGLDASGTYGVDEYTVRFISEDKCGNQEFEESTFEVRSCKLPTPYCLQGLSTTLTAMDTTGDGTADVEMVILSAEFFDAGSYHPCDYDVQLSFSSDVNDTEKSFFCSDTAGLQTIELWVTDENGGQDYCITYVDVQDNDTIDLCGGLKPVDIAGRIYTESDAELSDAEVELKSSESILTITDENGIYEFANMPEGGNYQVAAYKDDDHLNGVSTLDLVMIQRHVLGIAPLTSAYKMIAADINNNEKVSASDLVAIRKVILGIEESFPNNTSWRFIDAGFEFVNPENPWEVQIEESYDIIALSEDMQIDFMAVKTGDVNGNVDMNIAAGEGIEKRSSSAFTMELPDLTLEKDRLYEVEVKGVEEMKLFGMQHTLSISELELVDVLPGKMDMRKEYISIDRGQMHVSYASASGDEIDVNEVLFTMVFKAKQDGQLSDLIELSNKGLNAESYQGEDLSKGDIEITWREEDDSVVEMVVLEGNMPNPWSVSTELRFYIPSNGKVNLSVKDVSGRILMKKESLFASGNNHFIISQDDIKVNGILFYELKFENHIFNGKMIRIK